jgi:hypothetical protein
MVERPILQRQDLPYREAFLILNASRRTGMGGSEALSTGDILSLVKEGGIDYEFQMPKYLRLMQKLDRVLLEHQAEKAPNTKSK